MLAADIGTKYLSYNKLDKKKGLFGRFQGFQSKINWPHCFDLW